MNNHLNIKSNVEYLCILKDGTKFQGELLDFDITGKVLMKSKEGILFIKQYSKIKDIIEVNAFYKYEIGDLLKVKEDFIANNEFKLFKNEIIEIKSIFDNKLFLIKVIRSNKIKYSREIILDKNILFNSTEKIQFKVGDIIDVKDISAEAIVGNWGDGYNITTTVYKTRIKGEIYQIGEEVVFVNNIFDEKQYIIRKSKLI